MNDFLFVIVVVGIAAPLTYLGAPAAERFDLPYKVVSAALLLALGMAISTIPLAFVTISTAKQQGKPRLRRRQLSYLFFACILTGAIAGDSLLRNQDDPVKLTLIAQTSGFLITMVAQRMIPEANREGEQAMRASFSSGGCPSTC
jgi:zinc transporter ZupT